MDGLLTVPAVGDKFRGGVVTRRQKTAQGKIRLLVDGEWMDYIHLAFQPGDQVQLIGTDCWERELWPDGVVATVTDYRPDANKLYIVTAESQQGDPDPDDPDIDGRWGYVVDPVNWQRFTLEDF